MKKILLLTLLLCGCASPRYSNLIEVGEGIKAGDTKAVEWFFSDQMIYQRDFSKHDEFRPCDETIELGFGDCDDYAVCARDIVGAWPGWRSFIVYKGHRHVVTGVESPLGKYGYFDNGIFYYTSVTNFSYTNGRWELGKEI